MIFILLRLLMLCLTTVVLAFIFIKLYKKLSLYFMKEELEDANNKIKEIGKEGESLKPIKESKIKEYARKIKDRINLAKKL